MLLGLVYPSSGEIELLGRPVSGRVAEVLPSIGALIEGPAGYPHLSGRTNLAMLDAAGPGGTRRDRAARIERTLDWVGLGGVETEFVVAAAEILDENMPDADHPRRAKPCKPAHRT
jgi:ABC-2 type transport system ATP-binding protein